MNIQQLNETARAAEKEYRTKIETLAEITKTILENDIQKLLKENEELSSFRWIQYVPSFNDGDECSFTISCEGWDYSCSYDDFEKKPYYQKCKEIENFITEHYDLMREAYDCYVDITITKDSVNISDYYDH